jgi:hypothetical protein
MKNTQNGQLVQLWGLVHSGFHSLGVYCFCKVKGVATSIGQSPGLAGYNCQFQFWIVEAELELILSFGTSSITETTNYKHLRTKPGTGKSIYI